MNHKRAAKKAAIEAHNRAHEERLRLRRLREQLAPQKPAAQALFDYITMLHGTLPLNWRHPTRRRARSVRTLLAFAGAAATETPFYSHPEVALGVVPTRGSEQ